MYHISLFFSTNTPGVNFKVSIASILPHSSYQFHDIISLITTNKGVSRACSIIHKTKPASKLRERQISKEELGEWRHPNIVLLVQWECTFEQRPDK